MAEHLLYSASEYIEFFINFINNISIIKIVKTVNHTGEFVFSGLKFCELSLLTWTFQSFSILLEKYFPLNVINNVVWHG